MQNRKIILHISDIVSRPAILALIKNVHILLILTKTLLTFAGVYSFARILKYLLEQIEHVEQIALLKAI